VARTARFWLTQSEPPQLEQFVVGQLLMIVILVLALRPPRAAAATDEARDGAVVRFASP
jgi:hypothetical protein